MTDIDFDELDRAVSSIMSTKESTDSAQTKDEAVDEAIDPSTADVPTATTVEPEVLEQKEPVAPSESAVVDVAPPEEVTPEASQEAPAIVAKKRGQFMDVMHPSADMRTRPDPVSVSRRNVALKPSSDFEKKFTEEAESQAQEAPIDPVMRTNDWPGSIDLAPADTPEVAAPDTAEPEATTPLVSPFLPGAKPEKRPLGGTTTSDEASAIDNLDEPSIELAESTPEPAVPELTENTTPMPDELGADIMNVESGSMPLSSVAAAPSPVQPISESEESVAASGPSSIPQQYRTSEPSADVEHGALYDTPGQQEVLHPVKKRSGWLVPLIILLLLIVGGAAGYFVYTSHILG